MNGTQKKEIKKMVEETLTDMFKNRSKEIFSTFLEAMEDYGLSRAIREGRKNNIVKEKRIFNVLIRSR